MKRATKIIALLMAALMCLSLAACSGGNNAQGDETDKMAPIAKEDLKIGFLYVGPVGDEGYSFAHDQGRLKMMKEVGLNDDQSIIVENVPENSDCENAIRGLIDQGCNVIFSTSFGFMEWTHNVALEYPNVYFHHATGYTTDKNMSAYMGRMYEMRYLSGIAAGLKTKANKIGYVAAMPIPEVTRGANAFALGVQSVNPDATVEVLWTNNWVDPSLEKQAALTLIDKGCDVIGQHCDTTAPQVAAQEKGVYAVGYNAATYNAAPNAYLTSPLWDWGIYYTEQVNNIINGTWASENYWGKGHMDGGIVLLDELSPNCAEGTAEKIAEAQKKLDEGEAVFKGPLKDNTGAEKVAEGTNMTDEEMLSMDWFVEGIIGSVPKD